MIMLLAINYCKGDLAAGGLAALDICWCFTTKFRT